MLTDDEVAVRIEGPHVWIAFDKRELLFRADVASEGGLITALVRARDVVDKARAPMDDWIETTPK